MPEIAKIRAGVSEFFHTDGTAVAAMSARIEAQIKLQSAAKKRRKIAADKRKAKSLKKSRADPKQIGPKQALPKSAAKDKADETLLETVDPELVARAAAYDAPPPQDPDIKNEDADDRAQRKGNAGISVVDVLLEAAKMQTNQP